MTYMARMPKLFLTKAFKNANALGSRLICSIIEVISNFSASLNF